MARPIWINPDIDDVDPKEKVGPQPVAKMGPALPIVFGDGRVSGIVVYLSNIVDAEIWVSPVSKGPGKVADVVIAICEGPEPGEPAFMVRRIYSPNGELQPGTDPMDLLLSTDGQGSIEFVTSNDAPVWDGFTGAATGMALRGTVQMRAKRLALRDGKVPELSFLVRGHGNNVRVDPADVAKVLFSSWRSGAGLPAAQIDVETGSDGLAASSYRTYAKAAGLWVARVIDDREDAGDALQDLFDCTNSVPVWTTKADGTMVLRVVPRGDQVIDANGVVYQPPSVAYELAANEILNTEDNPVRVERTDEQDVFNVYPVTIRNEEAGYEEGTFEWTGLVDDDPEGRRAAAPYRAAWVTRPSHAVALSRLMAVAANQMRNRFTLEVPVYLTALEQMDLVSVSETAGFGLAGRVLRLERTKDASNGRRELTAYDWPAGAGTVIDLTPQMHDGYATPLPPPTAPAPGPEGPPGVDGQDAVLAYLTRASAVLPADAAGAVLDYSAGTTEMKVLVGATDDSAAWTVSKADSTGVTSSLVGRVVSVTGMTVDAGHVDLTATKGAISITRRFSLAKARRGATGTQGPKGDQGEPGLPGDTGPTGDPGSDALTAYLTMEAAVVACDTAGAPLGAGPYAVTAMKVMRGLTDESASWSFSVSPASSSGSVTYTQTGGTVTITGFATQIDTHELTITAARAGHPNLVKVFKLSKAKTGAQGPAGPAGSDAKTLVLTSTAQAFTYAGDGAASPASQTISFTAVLQNLAGTAAFTCTRYDAAGASLGTVTLGGTGNTRTLTHTQFAAAAYAVVTASLSGLSDQVTVVRLRDGATGATGAPGTAGDSLDIVFRRSASQPATPGASAGTPAGWYTDVASVPAGGDPLWSCVGTRTGGASTYTWQVPVRIQGLDGSAGSAGAAGLSVAEVSIYRRASSAPATPTGGSFTFPSTVTPPSGWSAAVPAGTDPLYVSRSVASVQGTSGTDSTLEWSAPVVMAQDGASATWSDSFTAYSESGPGGWILNEGVSPTLVSDPEATGGTALQAQAHARISSRTTFQFDPSALYRLRVRARRKAMGAAAGLIYVGLEGVAADGVTRVNSLGANSHQLQHYASSAAGAAPSVAEGWVDFVGYWKGWAPSGVPNQGGTTPETAGTLHGGVRFIRPLVFFNVPDSNDTYQVDLVELSPVAAPGANAVVGYLTNEAVTVGAAADGTVDSFASAGGTFRVFDGLREKTTGAGTAFSVVSESGVDVSIHATTGVYSVASMSADTGTATLRAVYGGVTIDKVYTIAKSKTGATGATGGTGAAGPRGSMTFFLTVAGTSWSDTLANNAANAYPTRTIGDTVTQTNAGAGYCETRVWSGSAWISPGTVLNGNLLVNGTVVAGALAARSVTAEKLDIGTGTNMLPNCDWSSQWTDWGLNQSGLTADRGINMEPALTLGGTSDAQNTQSLNTPYIFQNGRVASGSAYAELQSAVMQVEAGERYCASVYSGAHRAKNTIYIYWYNSAGTYLSASHSGAVSDNDGEAAGGTALAAYKRIYAYGTAPANAARAVVALRKWDTKASQVPNDSAAFFCRAAFEEIGSQATQPGPWTPAAKTIIDGNGVKTASLDADRVVLAGTRLDQHWVAGSAFAKATVYRITSGDPQVAHALNINSAHVSLIDGVLQLSILFDASWGYSDYSVAVMPWVRYNGVTCFTKALWMQSDALRSSRITLRLVDSTNGVAIDPLTLYWAIDVVAIRSPPN